MPKPNLIFLYTKKNRYSINALLGAMEKEKINSFNVLCPYSFEDLKTELKKTKAKTNIICFSFSTAEKTQTYKNIKEIKNGSNIIIAGGAHPSGDPDDAVKNGFDFVFKGEAEETFCHFLKNFPKPQANKIIIPGKKVSLDKYQSFSLKFTRFGPIEITRGCPYACKFCQTSYLFGLKPRHRKIQSVIKQVKAMSKIGLNDMRFITPDAMSYNSPDGKKMNLKEVEELLKTIKKHLNPSGRIFFGTFPSEIRPEHITEESLNLIKKYCHNKQVTIGVQTASDELLKKINRGHTFKDAENAINICLKNSIKPIIDLIFGLPKETQEDCEKTLDFVEKFSSKGAIIHAHTFTPLAGTPFAKAKASFISEKLRLKIKQLENKKLAFGKWEQEISKKTDESF